MNRKNRKDNLSREEILEYLHTCCVCLLSVLMIIYSGIEIVYLYQIHSQDRVRYIGYAVLGILSVLFGIQMGKQLWKDLFQMTLVRSKRRSQELRMKEEGVLPVVRGDEESQRDLEGAD